MCSRCDYDSPDNRIYKDSLTNEYYLDIETSAGSQYIEIEFCSGITIAEAVNELKDRAKDGRKYYGNFNTHILTSDMSLNDAYMEIINRTFSLVSLK